MRKLLRAGFAHTWKMKVFWIGMSALLVYGMLVLVGNYQIAVRDQMADRQADQMAAAFAESLFQHSVLVGVVAAVFCSLFVGMEYSNGTIRNKIVIGQSRTGIYFGNFINCASAVAIQVFSASAVLWATGYALMGKPRIGAVQFLWVCIMLLLICTAYASLCNLCAMLISSRTYAAILNVLLSVVLFIAAMYLSSKLSQPEMIQQYPFTIVGTIEESAIETVPNPYYISGLKRDVYQFLLDFLPGGQSLQLADLSLLEVALERPLVLCIYSVIITVMSNFVGMVLFQRKDIK